VYLDIKSKTALRTRQDVQLLHNLLSIRMIDINSVHQNSLYFGAPNITPRICQLMNKLISWKQKKSP